MIVITKQKKAHKDWQAHGLPYPHIHDPPDYLTLREQTKYIVIHNNEVSYNPYITMKSLDQVFEYYNTKYSNRVGVHFIIDPRARPILIYSMRAPGAVGNHLGDFYDKTSIGILILRSMRSITSGKLINPLTNENTVFLIFSLARVYNIPVENIVGATEALAYLYVGFEDSADKKELLENFWDMSPGDYGLTQMLKLRQILISLGLDIENRIKYDFLEHYHEYLIRKHRGNRISAELAYEAALGKDEIENISRHLHKLYSARRKFERALKKMDEETRQFLEQYLAHDILKKRFIDDEKET